MNKRVKILIGLAGLLFLAVLIKHCSPEQKVQDFSIYGCPPGQELRHVGGANYVCSQKPGPMSDTPPPTLNDSPSAYDDLHR